MPRVSRSVNDIFPTSAVVAHTSPGPAEFATFRSLRRLGLRPGRADLDVREVRIGDLDAVTLRLHGSILLRGAAPSAARVVLVGVQVRGATTAVLQGEAAAVRIERGGFLVIPSTTQGELRSDAAGMMQFVVVPTHVLTAYGLAIDSPRLMPATDGALIAPFAGLLEGVLASPQPWTPLAAYFVEKLLHEALGSVLMEAFRDAVGPRAVTSPYAQATAQIRALAVDPRLTPERVASSVGVSLRALQREFQRNGDSIADFIRRVRAGEARRLMAAPESATMTRADIAASSGFPSAAAMRRALSLPDSAG